MATRQRLTSRVAAEDRSGLGQSANDYWRKRAEAVQSGMLTETDKQLLNYAQNVANEEAAQLHVEPMVFTPTTPVAQEPVIEAVPSPEAAVQTVEPDAEVEIDATDDLDMVVTPSGEANEEEEETVRNAMVFEPRRTAAKKTFVPFEDEEDEEVKNKRASLVKPGVEDTVGRNQWHEMQMAFPQKTKGLSMLQVVPTSANKTAVASITEKLDRVAGILEKEGLTRCAMQLDVISKCLETSVDIDDEECED